MMNTPSDFLHMTFLFRNLVEEQLTLRLEPWGEEVGIPTGMTFRITADGPADGEPLIEIRDGCVVIHGWVQSVVEATEVDE